MNHRSLRLARVAAALLLACGSAPAQTPVVGPSAPEEAPAPALFQRVVVVGASVSDGYGLQPELKAEVGLGEVLDCMLLGQRRPTLNLGDAWLFQDPESRGADLVEEALSAEPTMVLAVDFLFWFGYSASWVRDKDRPAHLARGLALLERFECPLVVGDFPDVSLALGGEGPFGGPLLIESMVPTAEELAALNARLHEWAGRREHVVILPVSEFVRRATTGETIAVRGNRWEGGTDGLLQKDLLHPRSEGAIGLLVMTLDRLVAELDLPPGHVVWDAERVRARLMESIREEREETLERERRREERRRRRQERDPEDDGRSQRSSSVPSKRARMDSTRARFAPRSPWPTRDDDRTWTTPPASSRWSSTSSR